MSDNPGAEILASSMAQQMAVGSQGNAGPGLSLDDVVKDHAVTIVSRFIEADNEIRGTDAIYALDLMLSVIPDDQLKPAVEQLKDRIGQWDPSVDTPKGVVDEVFASSQASPASSNNDISVSLSFDAQNLDSL